MSMMRTRPGRSVTKSRPSGANAIDHGISRLVTTASTTNRTPSVVVNTSPAGVLGAGVEGAGAAGGSDGQARVSATWTASMKARMNMPNGMTGSYAGCTAWASPSVTSTRVSTAAPAMKNRITDSTAARLEPNIVTDAANSAG